MLLLNVGINPERPSMDKIRKYFPDLEKDKLEKLEKLYPIYEEWNSKINLISRKDFPNFYEKHVLHSLAIAKIVNFKAGTEILDVGTGGGFPGIPLAIIFPDTKFTLVDSIGKKIKVVVDVAEQLELKNVIALNSRVENINQSFDFIISRAVTTLPEFLSLTRNKLRKNGFNYIRNSVLYLKGGEVQDEIKSTGKVARIYKISDFFTEEFFETKYIIQI